MKTKKVEKVYGELTKSLGSEFHILLDSSLKDIEKVSSKEIASAVDRVRKGNIQIVPGYDGIFGVVNVSEEEKRGVY